MMSAETIVCEFNGLGELSANERILVEKIRSYAIEMCRQQREICAEHAELTEDFTYRQTVNLDTITGAPQPDSLNE